MARRKKKDMVNERIVVQVCEIAGGHNRDVTFLGQGRPGKIMAVHFKVRSVVQNRKTFTVELVDDDGRLSALFVPGEGLVSPTRDRVIIAKVSEVSITL